MTDYAKKENEVLDKIAAIIGSLDDELVKINSLDDDGKDHPAKQRMAEKRALHDIKKIIHEAGKYEKYDDKELDKIAKELGVSE